MEKENKKTKNIFWKILGAVIIIWLAVVVVKPVLGNRPMPLHKKAVNQTFSSAVGGDVAMDGIAPAPMMVESRSANMPMNDEAVGAVMPEEGLGGGVEMPTVDKRIIKNGSLRLKVESTEKSVEKIKSIAKQYQGEIANVNLYRQGKNGLGGNVTIKVPVKQFEGTLKSIKEVGDQVLSESAGSDDVTEEYVDLQAQIKNKKAEEETFRNLLERSGKLDDVLKVTREVARVRREIDQLEGRIKFMQSQTDMSTINVSLVEYEQVSNTPIKWKPARVAQQALHNLVLNIQQMADGIIVFAIATLPVLLLVALGIWIAYIIIRGIIRKIKR